jgi:hypothetical protein
MAWGGVRSEDREVRISHFTLLLFPPPAPHPCVTALSQVESDGSSDGSSVSLPVASYSAEASASGSQTFRLCFPLHGLTGQSLPWGSAFTPALGGLDLEGFKVEMTRFFRTNKRVSVVKVEIDAVSVAKMGGGNQLSMVNFPHPLKLSGRSAKPCSPSPEEKFPGFGLTGRTIARLLN